MTAQTTRTQMGKINLTRVLLGGLVAGLVINIGETILNMVVLGAEMEASLAARNLPPVGNDAIGSFVVMAFSLGIAIVWLYAAIRTRFGPGVPTAVLAGSAAWFFAYMYPHHRGRHHGDVPRTGAGHRRRLGLRRSRAGFHRRRVGVSGGLGQGTGNGDPGMDRGLGDLGVGTGWMLRSGPRRDELTGSGTNGRQRAACRATIAGYAHLKLPSNDSRQPLLGSRCRAHDSRPGAGAGALRDSGPIQVEPRGYLSVHRRLAGGEGQGRRRRSLARSSSAASSARRRRRWPTRSTASTRSTRSSRASTSTRACWPTRTRAMRRTRACSRRWSSSRPRSARRPRTSSLRFCGCRPGTIGEVHRRRAAARGRIASTSRTSRAVAPHTLSDSEEKILADAGPLAGSAVEHLQHPLERRFPVSDDHARRRPLVQGQPGRLQRSSRPRANRAGSPEGAWRRSSTRSAGSAGRSGRR